MGSERSEDLWIMRHIQLPKDGFYLDLGCAWPEQYSNTAFLRKRGWSGLCVDANPRYALDWKGVEKFVCCVIGDGTDKEFHYSPAPDLSRFGSGNIVPTVRLDDLVRDIPKIDFISCDLEGYEFDALSQFPWKKHLPKVVISEYNTHGIGEDFRVRDMLLSFGYRLVNQNQANMIFTLP